MSDAGRAGGGASCLAQCRTYMSQWQSTFEQCTATFTGITALTFAFCGGYGFRDAPISHSSTGHRSNLSDETVS